LVFNGGVVSLKINEFVYRVIEHPRDFLTARNLVIVGIIARLAITKLVEMLIDFVDDKRKRSNLRNIFRQPYEPGLLKNMDDVLTNATTDITFLGWRYITAAGYRGRIAMEEVADRIEWLSENQTNITQEDRVIGQTFANKIVDLYDQGDEKRNQNFFTGFVCGLRDRHFDLFGVREYGVHKWYMLSVFQKTN
jgi:hypothetical protein